MLRKGLGYLWIGCGIFVACGSSTHNVSSGDGARGGEPGAMGGSSQNSTAGAGRMQRAGGGGGTIHAGTSGEMPQAGDGGVASSTGGAAAGTLGDAGAGMGNGDAGVAGQGGGGTPPVVARLPVPCDAPRPTGFCFVSDPNDWFGHGQTIVSEGPSSVALSTTTGSRGGLDLDLTNSTDGSTWIARFIAGDPHQLLPGLYDPANGPAYVSGNPSLIVDSDASSCGENAVGKFSVEELGVDPLLGVTRFSITFEEHCGGTSPSAAAMRGVINFEATGELDASVLPEREIQVAGYMSRVVYDPSSDAVFGLDAENQKLSRIDLTTGDVKYLEVTEPPMGACVDTGRARLFVMNQACSVVDEYRTSDLGLVRSIAWTGTPADPNWAAPNVFCTPDRLYLTDGHQPPGLFTIEDLDAPTPTVVSHSAPHIGWLTTNAAQTDLYYWYRDAWNGGWVDTSVHHARTSDLVELDATDAHPPNIHRDPSSPIFLDEARSLVLVKNKILDAADLRTLVHEMPNNEEFTGSSAGDIYAYDGDRGHLATMTHLYDLDADYAFLGLRLLSYSIGSFFDRHGDLWSASPTFLVSERVPKQAVR